MQLTRQPRSACLANFDASFDCWTANGAPQCLHAKPIHHCACLSVVISATHTRQPSSWGLFRLAHTSTPRVRPEVNSEDEEKRVCFAHGINSHKRAVVPSVPWDDTAEHAAQPIGLLPHLQQLQSHVARDRGSAARRKGAAAFSSPDGP